MAALKHVGRIKNTGRRCVVVFREMYDETGKVIDENNCLVFETDNLPDAEHQELMRIVESSSAQSTGDLFNVLTRERLGTGITALKWLVDSRRLRKQPTNNVDLLPTASVVIGLDKINKIVKMQKDGASEAAISNMLRNDTDSSPREMKDILADVVPETPSDANAQSGQKDLLDDAALAKSFLDQAQIFERQATELREKAFGLDPTLKPKRGKRTVLSS